jgi:hypothetical protein
MIASSYPKDGDFQLYALNFGDKIYNMPPTPEYFVVGGGEEWHRTDSVK